MLTVGLTGSLRSAVGGAASVEIEARTIRDLLTTMADRYPAIRNAMDTGIAVAINGEIFRDNWGKEIPQDAEVFLLPRIQGG